MPKVFKLTEEEAKQKKIPRRKKEEKEKEEPILEEFVNEEFPLYTWSLDTTLTFRTQVRCFSISYHGKPLQNTQIEAIIVESDKK